MRHSSLSLGLFALSLSSLAACVRQSPQVLTPVRVDTATPASVTPAATASGIPGRVSHAAPDAAVRSVGEDPLHRIDRMDWPGPNMYREASGMPGSAYWQQRADYTIAATLDTAAQSVSGTVTIRYTNNSPDTLRFVWLQLDQNLYKPGSKGSALFPADSRWGVRGFEGGYTLDAVQVDGRAATVKVNDTMGRIDLDTPIAPRGGRATINISYRFRVPEHGSDRMGRDGTLYEIAQWYPRMAVYDDVRGWNTDPYLGQGEFYLEYGDIDYAVTVPAGYTVAGSGVLQNADEVLSAAQRSRIAQARTSSSVVSIITAGESSPRATPGTKTWRFSARDVRDVAWAAAPDFRWDATSWNGILMQAYYPWPRAGRAWESAAEQTQWSIRDYSELWFPYPYPQATSVAGTVGGMEYPMFVMVHYGNPPDDPKSIFGTIDHELGHQWFPMLVGSNERRYAWMDEGINTYQNAFALERRYPGTNQFPFYVGNWKQSVMTGTQSPLMTPPDRIDAAALGAIGYRKPGAVLLTLRDAVIGPEAMDRAVREYVRRWGFKHPTPADFFRTVENVSGEDLSWFWNAFFYGTDVLDIGIESVTSRLAGGQYTADIVLRKNSSVPFPVTLRLRYANGSTEDVHFPVEIWARTDRYQTSIPVRGSVTGARLWPTDVVPDWNPANDVWGNAPAPAAPKASTIP